MIELRRVVELRKVIELLSLSYSDSLDEWLPVSI